MLMRQPDCETEVVPSLHSNLAGAVSASDAAFCGVAACWGAGASATGFRDEAQPVHDSEISKTATIRIRVLPENHLAAESVGLDPRVYRPTPQVHEIYSGST
jgi:hypothetical protein